MRRLFFLALFAAAFRSLAQDSLPAPRAEIQEHTIDPRRRSVPGTLAFQRIVLTPADGSKPVAAELGRLTVLENRTRPDGATIDLAFVRLKTAAGRPGPPVVWLAGGPGGSGTEDAQGPLLPLLLEIAESSDVIALDQRGTGMSRPRLDCPGRLDLPLDRPMESGLVLTAFRRSATECRAHWTALGVDLASYNTNESARDVEDLRRALGVPRVSLLAGSYGTHLAFATIRLFEGSIERAVLFGISGPDHMERLPGDYQEVLEQIDRMVKRTPLLATVMPSFLGTVRTVLQKLERSPERVEAVDRNTGEQRTVTIGKFDIQCFTRNLLASRDQIARLPGLYLAMLRGDFREVASTSLTSRRAPAPPAVDFAMRCASGASAARREKARSQAGRALLGAVADFPIPDVCDAWAIPDLGSGFRAPLQSTVPVLFVSGTLDAHTPSANAKEVLAGFPNGRHLLVQDGAHGLLGFSLPKGRKLSAQFLRGEPVSASRLTTPPFGFLVPGLGRDAAIAAEFGGSIRAMPAYRSGPY